jgi:hypothetical protein
MCGLDSSGSGWGTVVSSCKYDNEISGSIMGGNFLTR